MTSNDDKKATKMTVAIGWGVVAGVLISLALPHWKFWSEFIPIVILALIVYFPFVWLVLKTGELIDDPFKSETTKRLDSITTNFEIVETKFYFVPKADLHEAIEAIELNDTSTALTLLKAVVDKAGRDE